MHAAVADVEDRTSMQPQPGITIVGRHHGPWQARPPEICRWRSEQWRLWRGTAVLCRSPWLVLTTTALSYTLALEDAIAHPAWALLLTAAGPGLSNLVHLI